MNIRLKTHTEYGQKEERFESLRSSNTQSLSWCISGALQWISYLNDIHICGPFQEFEDALDLQESLAVDGYHWVILEDTTMDAEVKPSNHDIIFYPTQTKFIFNDGTYDLDDDNFMSQLGRM